MERKCLHSTYICLLLILLLNKTSAIAVASYNNDADDSTAYLASNHFDRLVYSYYNNNNNNNNNNDSSMLYNFNNHSAAAAAGSKTLDSAGLLTTGANHHHDYHEAAVTTDAYLDSHSSMFCSGSILQCLFLSLVLGLMIISTIIGNSFVIAAVVLERNLQGVANYLIVSLAVADLTVAIMVMPIGAYQEVYHTWNLGGVLCDIWTSFDVLCCTASILHLVAIALDRYWAITNVHYGAKRTAKRIVTMIVFIWTLSALMAISPHLFGLSYEASSSERCQLTNNLTFQLVSTLGAFYLPLVVMCIIYWKIFQSAKFRIRSKGAGMTSVQRRKEEEKARRRSPKSILPSDEQNNKVEAGEAGEEKDDGHNVATRFLIRTSRSLSFSARKSPANSSSQKPPSITNITGNNRHNSKNSLATGGNTTTNNETSFTRNNLRQQSLRVVRADRTDDIAKPAAKPALELPPQVPTTNQTPTTLLLPTSNHTTATTDTNSTSTTKESAAQKQSESSVSPNLSTSPNQGHKSIKSIIKKNMFVFSHIALLQKARQAAERPFDDELYDNQSDEEYEEEVKEANKSSSSQKKISPPKQSVDEHHHNHNHQHKSHHEKKSTAAINRQNSSYDNNTSSYHQTTDNNTKPNNNQIKKYLEDRRVNKSGNNNTQPVARKSNTFVFGLKEEDERTKAAARKLSSVLTDRIGAGHDYCHRESQVSQKSGGWLQPDKSLAMYEDSTLFNVASSTRASYAYSENDTEEGSMFDLNRQRHASSSSSTRLNLNPPPIESSSAPVATAVTGASFAAVVAAAAHANRVKKISFNENEKSPNTEKASQTNNKLKTTSNILNEFERTPKSNQPQRLNMIASISSQSRSSTTSTSNNDYSAKCKDNNDIEHTLSTTALAEPSHNTPHNNTGASARIAGSNNSFRIEGTKTSDLAKKRARIDIKRERKAAKTLGVIMTCFIVCWLPFFLMQILFSICSDCYLSQLLERSRLVTILTWSGYLNSLLNPVIYTIFSPDFRIAFAKILFGKYSSRNRRPRK